jgi:hypothetical protein
MFLSGLPRKFGISVPDGRCRKLNQRMFSFWIRITIVLRNPFESLHPVLEDALQSLGRDPAQYGNSSE